MHQSMRMTGFTEQKRLEKGERYFGICSQVVWVYWIFDFGINFADALAKLENRTIKRPAK